MIKCVYNGLKVGHNPVKKKEKIDPNQVWWLE